MNRQLQPALTAFALGLIGLGVLALIYRDFALVWQPVPAFLPGRSTVALASGLLMVVGGISLFFRESGIWSARLLLPYLFVWMLLKVPGVIVAPQMEAVWLGLGEVSVFFAGGWVVFAINESNRSSRFAFLSGPKAIDLATLLFGLSLIPIGLSHIFYTGQTVDLIPVWLPFRTLLAYLTGIGQICCGVAVLFSFTRHIAAAVEAGMVSLFALFVWLPRILASPKGRLPWTAFFITWFFAACAWVISRGTVTKRNA